MEGSLKLYYLCRLTRRVGWFGDQWFFRVPRGGWIEVQSLNYLHSDAAALQNIYLGRQFNLIIGIIRRHTRTHVFKPQEHVRIRSIDLDFCESIVDGPCPEEHK